MTTLLFSLAFVVLTVALLLMSMTVKRLSEEIDELKDGCEYHKKIHNYEKLMLEPKLKEFDQRLDQLEEVLDLKEYFDEEPEPNTDNQ